MFMGTLERFNCGDVAEDVMDEKDNTVSKDFGEMKKEIEKYFAYRWNVNKIQALDDYQDILEQMPQYVQI